MTFWWIVLALVVVGVALAWWTSGALAPAALPPGEDRLGPSGRHR